MKKLYIAITMQEHILDVFLNKPSESVEKLTSLSADLQQEANIEISNIDNTEHTMKGQGAVSCAL